MYAEVPPRIHRDLHWPRHRAALGQEGKKMLCISDVSATFQANMCEELSCASAARPGSKPVDFNSDIWWFPQIGVPKLTVFLLDMFF